jgi:hypothetical protein
MKNNFISSNSFKEYDSGKITVFHDKKCLKLTPSEILCDRFLFKKSKNVKLLKKAEFYVDMKLSIEFILKKLIEIDKLKFVLFDTNQLNLVDSIKNPNFHQIFYGPKILDDSYTLTDKLWKTYDFYVPDYSKEKESYNVLKHSFKTDITERLLKLVELDYS